MKPQDPPNQQPSNSNQPLSPPPPPAPKQVAVPQKNNPQQRVIRPGAVPYDRRHRKTFSWPIFWFSIITGGVVIFLVMAVYMFFYQPRIVLADYVRKLAEVKTGTATGSMVFKSSNNESVTLDQKTLSNIAVNGNKILTQSDITFDMKFDIRNPADPMFETRFALGLSGVTAHADTLIDNKSLYVRIEDTPLAGIIGLKLNQDWYKIPLPPAVFEKSTCTLQDQEHSILSRNVLRFMPVKSVRRKTLYENIQGHRTIHTTGEVNMEKLGQSLAQANNSLPEQCRIYFDEEKAKNSSAFYDLYSSKDFDRLSVTVIDKSAGRETNVILDTTNYGQDFRIETPDNVHDITSLAQVFSTMLGGQKP